MPRSLPLFTCLLLLNHVVVAREEIAELVRPVIEAQCAPAIVVACVEGDAVHVYGYGQLSRENPIAPDGDTVFEIGSISKVFTGLLLAEMCQRGEVSLETPLAELLPAGVTPPATKQPMTLIHLATHRSGLPRLPGNLSPMNWEDPYADYTVEQLYGYVSGCRPEREPGDAYEYSNLGMGLLGHVLALRANQSYEQLLIERICRPLGMGATRCTPDEQMLRRLAPGHDGAGWRIGSWQIPVLAGAGAIRSTANDLAEFVMANLAGGDSPLEPAIRAAQAPQQRVGGGMDIGLGWHIFRENGVLVHDGGTGGYSSLLALHPEKRIGVVVLANGSTEYVNAIGLGVMKRMLGEPVEPMTVQNPLSRRMNITAQRMMIRGMAEAAKNAARAEKDGAAP